jgi:DHA2 family methylenomycin A resistance protein-like MFS transporter
VAFYGLIFVFSLFFQRGQHFSALQAGLAFAPMTVAIMAANAVAGRLDQRLGARVVIAGGALLMAGGAAALEGIGPHTAFAALVVQLVAIGFGLGLIVPVMTAALLGSVDRSRSGVASGTLNTARQTGSVIGVALFGSLIAGGRLVGGLHVALVITAGLSLVVAALGVRTRAAQT